MELQCAMGLLEAVLIERSPHLSWQLPEILQVLLPLLQSPLAAPRVQSAFLDIGACLMPKDLQNLGKETDAFIH